MIDCPSWWQFGENSIIRVKGLLNSLLFLRWYKDLTYSKNMINNEYLYFSSESFIVVVFVILSKPSKNVKNR